MRPLVPTLLLCLLAAPLAQAAPSGCFTAKEMAAERLVRQGLYLREGAMACDGNPWNFKTLSLWQDIDAKQGVKFAAQTKLRTNAFKREYPKNWQFQMRIWDGRIVMHYRNYPLGPEYCGEVKKRLQEVAKGGWNSFNKQAVIAPDEVKFSLRVCQ